MDTIDEGVLQRLEEISKVPQQKIVNQWMISLGLIAITSLALYAAVQTTRPADVLKSTLLLHDKVDHLADDVRGLRRQLQNEKAD